MANIYNMVDAWTSAGTTYTAVKMAVTDTASNAASALMDLTIGGASRFFVKKDGSVGLSTNAPVATLDINGSFATRGGTVALLAARNDNVATPATALFRITGPGAAYQIGGLAGGVDGRRITIINTVAQTLGFLNEDLNSSPSNRITTLTGATVSLGTNRTSAAQLIYDATAARWVLLSTS